MNGQYAHIPLTPEEEERVRALELHIDFYRSSDREGGITPIEADAQIEKSRIAINGVLVNSEAHRMMAL